MCIDFDLHYTLTSNDQSDLHTHTTRDVKGAEQLIFYTAHNIFFYPEFHSVGAMTSHVKLRKERLGLVDYDTQIKGTIITSIGTIPSLLQPILTVINMCCPCGKRKPCKIRFLPTARLSELVIFSGAFLSPLLCFLFRDALPACRPAEGFGLAT